MDKAKKKENDSKYRKEHFYRLGIDIQRPEAEAYRKGADLEGCTLAGWAKMLMRARCEELGIPIPQKEG